MNKKIYIWFGIAGAFLLTFVVGVLGGYAQDIFGEKPTPIPAKEQTPAPTPEDRREIAILTLVISSTPDGKIEGVKLERSVILQGYAPNVLGMQGEWTIELVGAEQTISYGVLDPRHVEVENEQDAKEPYTYIYETNYVWELVVPLFDNNGKDLQIMEINIYDAGGNKIFGTPVDREGWRK